jgi:hypothetical protein
MVVPSFGCSGHEVGVVAARRGADDRLLKLLVLASCNRTAPWWQPIFVASCRRIWTSGADRQERQIKPWICGAPGESRNPMSRKSVVYMLAAMAVVGVLAYAGVLVHQSSALALKASNHAVDVQNKSDADRAAADKAAASKAAADKAIAEKVAADAHDKAIADAAAAKALADKATADKAAADKKAVAERAYRQNVDPIYAGSFGTFPLTSLASPGPIHVYSQPDDSSVKLYPVFADQYVTVYCSVVGTPIDGHARWDWTGDGWIWDQMVDMNGHTPPSCYAD